MPTKSPSSFFGEASVTMAMLLAKIRAAPNPWIARKMMTSIGVIPKLVRAEPNVNTAKPIVYRRILPNMSDSLPMRRSISVLVNT